MRWLWRRSKRRGEPVGEQTAQSGHRQALARRQDPGRGKVCLGAGVIGRWTGVTGWPLFGHKQAGAGGKGPLEATLGRQERNKREGEQAKRAQSGNGPFSVAAGDASPQGKVLTGWATVGATVPRPQAAQIRKPRARSLAVMR